MKDVQTKIMAFNKRFKVISNENYGEELSKFKTRILNKFKNIDNDIEIESLIQFCDIFGITRDFEYEGNSMYGFGYCKYIYERLSKETNEIEFYRIIQIIFLLDFISEKPDLKTKYYEFLKEALEYSFINLEVKYNKNEVLLYPKGEELLDEQLVNNVLDFLDFKSNEHLTQALKFYQTKNEKSYIKAAESLRRALEEFLRFKLQNNKGLAQNITDIQILLKKNKRDEMIRKIIYGVFTKLDEYFNENSKHKDGDIDEAEIEYLIYQTGVLMRYVNLSI